MSEEKENKKAVKRKRGRLPQMMLHIDAKPEDIAWALTNTSPKELEDWKPKKGKRE